MTNNSLFENRRRRRMFLLITRILGGIFCVVGLSVIGFYVYQEYHRPIPPPPPDPPVIVREDLLTAGGEELPEVPATVAYPEGKLIIVAERPEYQNGEITLYIPRLRLQVPVLNGTDPNTLEQGVGLFDYSQLPMGLTNSNVSLAGHRDAGNMEFYYLDSMEAGDHIYLMYQGILYTYQYETTFITDAANFDPIRVKEYPALTLQTCSPLVIANKRMFVVARLTEVTPGGSFPQGEEPPEESFHLQLPKDSQFPEI